MERERGVTLTSSIPVMRVSDYPRARAFYEGVLGFAVLEEAGDPVIGFGIYRLGAARVFLTAWDGPEAAYDRWRAYFHTDDLPAIEARLKAAEATYKGPTRTFYNMDEIEVSDPDGNVLCFGTDA